MKKRLIISIITLIIVTTSIYLEKQYVFPAYKPQPVSAQTETPAIGPFKGVTHKDTDLHFSSEVKKLSSQSGLSLPSKDNIGDKIKNIQEQLKYININKLPPPVQGILRQIQDLSKQPLNGIKNACLQVCSKI